MARPLLSFVLVAAAVTVALALIQQQQAVKVAHEAETALARSTAEIVDGSRSAEVRTTAVPPDEETADSADFADLQPADRRGASPISVSRPAAEGDAADPHRPFTGRYRLGPEAARVRIVVISSYQCADCRRIDEEIAALMAGQDDISFSHKHFPFCRDCNRFARERKVNLHPNGCWAARAAEAAGRLQGNEGFWTMHRWLFRRQGAFTAAELQQGLQEMDFDPGRFLREMQGNETLRRVEEDIEEAMALGLTATPMVFINGVELKGWSARQAVTRAVAALTATDPPALTAAADDPPEALEKFIDDWRRQAVRSIPLGTNGRFLGTGDASLRIVVWGDYQEPFTAELDRRIRQMVAQAGEARVRYSFRHFPVDQSCNPVVPTTRHPLACRAAHAAEAAWLVAGDDAYWRMHRWLLEHQEQFSDEQLESAVGELGLDVGAFIAAMEDPQTSAAIEEDVRAAERLGLKSVPFLFIGGKWVPHWRVEDRSVVESIVEEALANEPVN